MAAINVYRTTLERMDPRAFELEPEHLDRMFSPDEHVGRWSCRGLLTHLLDAEIVYAHRMRRTLAEQAPVFEDFDHEAFLDDRVSGMPPRNAAEGGPFLLPAGAVVASIHTLRQTMTAMLFQLDEADWNRRAMHPDRGQVIFRDLLNIAAWHTEYHGLYLNAKVQLMLGPPPAKEACEDHAGKPGGCGSGCGCASKASE